MRRALYVLMGILFLLVSSSVPARAQQDWPQRALRILVGTSPGGSPDIISRLRPASLAA